MEIEITFINNSNDKSNSNIVIFQKNIATNFESTAIAWKVIKNCGRNWSHSFTYPMHFEVASADAFGNVSDQRTAYNGQKWSVVSSNSGEILQLDSAPTTRQNEIEVRNKIGNGAIDAQIYKDGKLLATKTAISSGEKAKFEFKPEIHVGVTSQVKEGDIMSSAVINEIDHKFSLLGITKANLIMTGGGSNGKDATPFKFELVPIT
ncbi:MAG: hypothetical protein JKY02_09160 [Flavobacteriaceae bacterium]|nr:hypothetical protein [Flavobacteriaceae bacterium]